MRKTLKAIGKQQNAILRAPEFFISKTRQMRASLLKAVLPIFLIPEKLKVICSYVTYKDEIWVIHRDTTHSGRIYYKFDKYDGDLNVVDSFRLYWIGDDEDEKDRTYYYNDEEISEDQYNEYYTEIFGE
jgi:hypothetical protein